MSIERTFKYCDLTEETSEIFCSNHSFDEKIIEAFVKIGKPLELDRIYILKQDKEGEELYLHCDYEWVNQNVPSIKSGNQYVPLDSSFPLYKSLLEEEYIIVDSSTRPQKNPVRPGTNPETNFFITPIKINGTFWGCIGFDKIKDGYVWPKPVIRFLHSMGYMMNLIIINAVLQESCDALQKRLSSAMEETTKANNIKTDFLSRISHEIRTPVNAISGLVSMVRKTGSLAEANDYVSKIDKAANQLLSVVSDILEMSEIYINTFELTNEEFSLEKLLIEVTDSMVIKSNEKNLELLMEIAPNISNFFYGDALRFSQVISQVMANAIKFTPDFGTIRLRVSAMDIGNADTMLFFEVEDTGIGMTQEQLASIFEPFEQIDTGKTRRYGGTGLGLPISKKIITLMGGSIHVVSEPGKGSTFSFNVKLKKSVHHERKAISSHVDLSTLRILVVDDSEAILEYFSTIFEELKIQYTVSNNAREALELFKQANKENHPYSIIFTDWIMPELDGIEFAELLKKENTRNAVVVLISMAQLNQFEEKAVKAGVKKFLSKPLFPSDLVNIINEVTGISKDSRGTRKEPVPDFTGKKILLVEDIQINQEIILSFLKDTHGEIDIADNGSIAVERLLNGNIYDIILMDIHMPVMDGYQATQRIRQLDIRGIQNIPIIAMTANVFREDIRKCLALGMNDHIAKPVDFDILLNKLKRYLLKEDGEKMSGEIDYIDIEEGLKRVLGNKNLYIKLLKKFKDETDLTGLVDAISNNDLSVAREKAHTIKGIAANLSLKKLFLETQELESRIKEGIADQVMMESLKNTFGETIKKIEKVIEENGSTT